MMPFQSVGGGKFTLTTALIASGVQVEHPGSTPDFIVCKSLTGWGEASDAQAIEWFWEKSLAQGTAKGILQASEGSTPQLPAMTSYAIATNGIRSYNTGNPPTYAGLATTAVDRTTYVALMADTGSIQVGDWVRPYATTGMLQIAGYPFQVTAVTTDTSITLGYMATGAEVQAADATAGTFIKYIPDRMYPRSSWIASVSAATQCVVYFTGKNDYTVGENLSFRVSSAYGMKELNNVTARVLVVTNSATESSVTLDLDSTAFTAFVFPTSAAYLAGVSPAVAVPSSSGVIPASGSATSPQIPVGTQLRDAFDNRNINLIEFGLGLWNVASHASDNSDEWLWQAYKYDQYSSAILN